MPKPVIVPELLRSGEIASLSALSDSIGQVFEIGRKKKLGISHTKNIAIYNEHVQSIKTNIQDLLNLHLTLQTNGVENPHEILEQKAKAIQASMLVLSQTTKDPVKKQFLLDQMTGVMNALSYARSEIVRAPLRAEFAELQKQTKTDYLQGKHGYYDAYVKKHWETFSANYGKQLQEHVAKVHKKEFEAALENKVQEAIAAGGLGLERRFEEMYLESFTRAKEYELNAQGKSFKTITPEEGKTIQAEFNAKFKDWVTSQVLAQGFKENFQGTPQRVLEKEFKADFDKKFHDQYKQHCGDRIKHYENEIKVALNPGDPKIKQLQLEHMKDVINDILATCKGNSPKAKIAATQAAGFINSIEDLESKIKRLTNGGISPKDAGDAALGINMMPQVLASLLKNCESPKAKEIMAREFPAFFQQIQGINLGIQAAQMQCEMGALQRMQGEISSTHHLEQDVMLNDELDGGPLDVNPQLLETFKTDVKMKSELQAQKAVEESPNEELYGSLYTGRTK
ncbi:hypothetical protein [Legionella saoudiensis]|uniref:hypothetical protein n=1 Tax=Legionella saoudiensis TaxID=1750561 RepID=UPI00072FAA1F|nr:hypothetical protein [Legionella saoudiensis]